MLGNFKKEDLRIKRTYRALTEALPKLLRTRNFERITVNDLCDEAQLSRSAFYAHFQDKFDLLKYCLTLLKPFAKNAINDCMCHETEVNTYINKNSRIITNLIEDANAETRGILIAFLISTFDIPGTDTNSPRQNTDNLLLAHLCAGGILNIMEWHVKNRCPESFRLFNRSFCAIFKNLLESCKKNT